MRSKGQTRLGRASLFEQRNNPERTYTVRQAYQVLYADLVIIQELG